MVKATIYELGDTEDEGTEFRVDYVSLVNKATFGPPALVAPREERAPTARPGQTVLYVNTNLVPFFKIEREAE